MTVSLFRVKIDTVFNFFSASEIVNPFARFPHTQDGAKINRLAPVWLSWMPDDFLVN
jgi:hypothetical protein